MKPRSTAIVHLDGLTVDDVLEGWNDTARHCELTVIHSLTDRRRREVAGRLAEFRHADFRKALDAIEASAFFRGGGPRGWGLAGNLRLDARVRQLPEAA